MKVLAATIGIAWITLFFTATTQAVNGGGSAPPASWCYKNVVGQEKNYDGARWRCWVRMTGPTTYRYDWIWLYNLRST